MSNENTETSSTQITLDNPPDCVVGDVTDINQLLTQMDQVFNHTARSRHRLHAKLENTIETMNLSPNGDPEQLEAQLNLLDKLDKVNSSREKSFTTRITTRLKHNETEATTKLVGAISARMLKDFVPSGATAYVPSATEELSADAINEVEQRLAAMSKIDYNEGELKRDPTDIS